MIFGKGKTIETETSWFPGTEIRGKRLVTKELEATFYKDENILNLSCGGGYTTICTCQNS